MPSSSSLPAASGSLGSLRRKIALALVATSRAIRELDRVFPGRGKQALARLREKAADLGQDLNLAAGASQQDLEEFQRQVQDIYQNQVKPTASAGGTAGLLGGSAALGGVIGALGDRRGRRNAGRGAVRGLGTATGGLLGGIGGNIAGSAISGRLDPGQAAALKALLTVGGAGLGAYGGYRGASMLTPDDAEE